VLLISKFLKANSESCLFGKKKLAAWLPKTRKSFGLSSFNSLFNHFSAQTFGGFLSPPDLFFPG